MKMKLNATKFLAWHCIAIGTAILSAPTLAQESGSGADPSLKEFLSGSRLPLTIQLKTLDSSYRRITLQGQADSFSSYVQMMGGLQGYPIGNYYTKGDTIKIGDETYLVAYRSLEPIDPQFFQNFGHGDPVIPRKPSPNSRLALSLLNLRTSGSINDVRPFDPKRDMETEEEANQVSVRTLQTLGQGFLGYVRYRAESRFPKSSNVVTAQFRRAAYPSVHDERTWKHPGSGEPYRYNQKLSNMPLNRIVNGEYLILFYEPKAASDGRHGIVFVDGHTERVDSDRFERLQAVSVKVRPPAPHKKGQRPDDNWAGMRPEAPGMPPPPPPAPPAP